MPLDDASVTMSPLFDAYVVVDWSAASSPVTGSESIWVCRLERRDHGERAIQVSNFSARCDARHFLADLLSDYAARDLTTLAGFDFAFGYPAGFGRRLRPNEPNWRGVWKEIAARIRDGEDNANNRFEVAAQINALVSGTAFPFWNCPVGASTATLTATKPAGFGDGGWQEYRLTDRAIRGRGPQSVWKLYTAGNVGSQTLLGIANLFALRHDARLMGTPRIWPFETGLAVLERPGDDPWRAIFAEVYPSMIEPIVEPGDVKDQAQVRTLARYFADLDEDGRLGALFAGPVGLSDEQRQSIETEEGWILGIESSPRAMATAAPPPPTNISEYIRDPQEIYRRSFALVKAATDLSQIPPDLKSTVVRLVHACGMPDIVDGLAFSDDVARSASIALEQARPILVDCKMVASGITRGRLKAANPIICTLYADGVNERAKAQNTTRSAAAVDLWRPHLDDAIVAIGNAPTALFRLLELIAETDARPAAILAFPVGFVGAAESKEALITSSLGVPFLTLRGRRGGSALASAAVNALAGGQE